MVEPSAGSNALTIFDQIGGSEAIDAAVDEFYERVLDDPVVAASFDGVDMTRLKAHQRAYLTLALGGPDSYVGRPLADAHDGLGITEDLFERTVAHLLATLVSLDVEPALVSAVEARLRPTRKDIVGPSRVAS